MSREEKRGIESARMEGVMKVERLADDLQIEMGKRGERGGEWEIER